MKKRTKYSMILSTALIVYVSFHLAISYYKSAKLKRLYFSNESVTSTIISDKIDILIFGDSRASAWSPSYFGSRNTIINMGIGGETTNSMLSRLNENVIQHSPKHIIICAGINDIIIASMIDEPSSRQTIVENAAKNLKQILSILDANDIHIILLKITPPYDPNLLRNYIWGDNIEADVRYVNHELVKHANSLKNIKIIDVQTLFTHHGKNWKDLYKLDALHYTSKAYELLSNTVSNVLLSGK